MNKLSLKHLASVIVLTIALSACTTSIEISHTETRKVAALSDSFRTVNTQKIPDPLRLRPGSTEEGLFLIELESKADLELLIHQREMAFLYYELRPCGDADKSAELYSAPAYTDNQATSIEAGSFRYYAAVPENYADEIGVYQKLHGRKQQPLPSEICLGLAAGNMAGERLTTNLLRIELR